MVEGFLIGGILRHAIYLRISLVKDSKKALIVGDRVRFSTSACCGELNREKGYETVMSVTIEAGRSRRYSLYG